MSMFQGRHALPLNLMSWIVAAVLTVASSHQIAHHHRIAASFVRKESEEALTKASAASVSVDSHAKVLKNDGDVPHPHHDIFVSPEAKEKLHLHHGLPRDEMPPRRDALLQQRAEIIRQRIPPKGNHTPVLPHEASLLAHAEKKSAQAKDIQGKLKDLMEEQGVSRVFVATPISDDSDGESRETVPDWRKFALAEDGSPDIQALIPASKSRGKVPPKWAMAGLAEEGSESNVHKEMSRLGRTMSQETRQALADAAITKAAVPARDSRGVFETGYDATAGPADDYEKWWRVMGNDEFAFRYYKFTPLKVRTVEHAQAVSLAEIRLWAYGTELAMKDMTVAFNELGLSPKGEEVMKARDGNRGSKWTDFHMGSILVIMAWPVVATNFGIVTSGDHPERDPVQWYWEGSKNLKNWTMLLGQLSDAGVPDTRSTDSDLFSWKVDCRPSEWEEWGPCSSNCSGGNATRVRGIGRHSWNDGECKPSGGFFQVQVCNEEPCPVPMMKGSAFTGSPLQNLVLALATLMIWQSTGLSERWK